jgi:hypothetical protein
MTVVVEVPERKSQAFGSSCVELSWTSIMKFSSLQRMKWITDSLQVTRYSFYGMKESFGFTPSWLLWLRLVLVVNKPY